MIDPEELLRQILLTKNSFYTGRGDFMNRHPNFNTEKDARITIFSKCLVGIDSMSLCYMFRTYNLLDDSWWGDIWRNLFESTIIKMDLRYDPNERRMLTDRLDMFFIAAYFHLIFSSLESSMRIIMRAVSPGKFNDGRGNFKEICKSLLSASFPKYECMLELLRLVRNTIHNNGVYFPDKIGDNRSVTYRGITYNFTDSILVELGDLPRLLFFDFTPDLLNMIKDIVESADVLKHPQIIDPSI